jgi:Cu2+-exporting ATPase
VAGVLLDAAIGFVMWMLRSHDVTRSMDVATAVLIVTCPCAFGIATPLAYELAYAGLRRLGLYVRAPGFLDRAAQVHTVVFDKTGTVTSGSLTLANPDSLDAPDAEASRVALALSVASHHPKSIALKRALEARGIPYEPSGNVVEEAGRGLQLEREGHTWRLGAPAWVSANASNIEGDLALARDGHLLAVWTTQEEIRPDAANEVRALGERGLDVWLLSGDTQGRVEDMARACGIAQDRAVGERTADGKAAWALAHDRDDLLMVGDGINDALVVDVAFCSGTPAIDRPFMAARSDFYFVSPGLRPVRKALDAARALARVRRRNVCIALAYNAVAVALAWAGVMSPLVCAVLMPVSSISTIGATTWALSPRSRLWKS